MESRQTMGRVARRSHRGMKSVRYNPYKNNRRVIPSDLSRALGHSLPHFQDLLESTGKLRTYTFREVFGTTDIRHIADGSAVENFRSGESEYKVVRVEEFSKYHFDLIKSEVKITKNPFLLKDGGRNRTSAFVELFGTWIVWDYGLNSTEYKQLYVVYKTEYAGMPLQEFVHSLSPTADQVASITRQVALALTAAECELNFEHRDLDAETVLIRPTSRSQLTFRVDGESHSVNSYGYKATIVNFSASRATINDGIYYTPLDTQDYRQMIIQEDWAGFYHETNSHAVMHLMSWMSSYVEEAKFPLFAFLARYKNSFMCCYDLDYLISDCLLPQISSWKIRCEMEARFLN